MPYGIRKGERERERERTKKGEEYFLILVYDV
jgi:hypothetical protein